ncbi:DUF2809 domain-containing protein [Flavobacterium sp.]|uniref:ribosomal maturation YjgA family protein n=1 Tax=Flavobacterium sp. TaxID=239 RepID=UPI002B4AD90D|nr:DUF2809 domain-containing protein [Flavobacterium sp.]HLP64574.1 DUF2809 domain-containing protein [Flavobacterium sp.]
MKKIKLSYLLVSIALFITEIMIAIYAKDDFIRPLLGDYLAVILLYYLLATFFAVSKTKIALLALAISYVIEGLQYLNILKLLRLEDYSILRIVLGTSFSWTDMLAYTLGIVTVLFIHNFKKIKS